MHRSVEVILCTYNGARFLTEQWQSILRQTVTADKVSIYDDRSTDDTVDLIQTLVAALPLQRRQQVTITVNERNVGYAANFANAISKATGEVLFFSDQDDVWEDNKVQVLLNLLCEQRSDMAFSDGLLIGPTGARCDRKTVLQSYGLSARHVRRFHEDAFDLLMKRNYINGAAMAVRREAAQSALPLPRDMPHDYWLSIWCALQGGIAATPQQLYRYRLHDRNAIGIGSSILAYEFLGIWRHARSARARELRIWKGVTERIDGHPRHDKVLAARRKLDWLTRLMSNVNWGRRAVEISRSALDGSYRNFSPPYSLLRDIVSLIQ